MSLPPEPHREGEVFAVAPLTGGGKRRGTLLAVSVVLVGLVAIVGAGVVGRVTSPASNAGPAPRPTTAAVESASPGASGSDGPAAGTVTTTQVPLTSFARAGYHVSYWTDSIHQPIVFDDGALVVYGFGERLAEGTFDGTIYVSVGSPARPAAVLGHAGLVEVSGTTLDELEQSYRRTRPGQIGGRASGTVDGEPAVILDIVDGPAGVRSAALFVHRERAFVITSSGFAGMFPAQLFVPARQGLDHFLEAFTFGTSLFVSRELGFQVPQPMEAKPFGVALQQPRQDGYGFWVFGDGFEVGDGQWSHSIAVSVGSETHPALVRTLPSRFGVPDPLRIWAASLVELQAEYLGAIGGTPGSVSTVQLGSELGLVIEHPDGLAKAILAIHRGRIYIVSTSGFYSAESAPGFDEFVAAFTFLE